MRTYYEIFSEARRSVGDASEEQVIQAANGMYLAERLSSAIVKATADSVDTVMNGRQGYAGLRELMTSIKDRWGK